MFVYVRFPQKNIIVTIILIVLIKDATVLIALCAECSLRIIKSVCGPSNLVGLTSVVILLYSQHKCCYVIVTIVCHEIFSPPTHTNIILSLLALNPLFMLLLKLCLLQFL